MQTLHLLALLCCLATAFAVPTATHIKWCVISDFELQKCSELAGKAPLFTCLRKGNAVDCMIAIKAGEADVITLSAANIYQAGLQNYNLVPIIAESYNSENNDGRCSYSVAVAKKNTDFFLKDLSGKKSCHTGYNTPEGWILPIGTLLVKGLINWGGTSEKTLQTAVSQHFSESCVPGADEVLRSLCGTSTNDVGAGAFRCLQEGRADVAFMNPADIPEHEKGNYQLLCQDDKRMSVDDYKSCNLGEEPARAVVTRQDMDRQTVELIYTTLTTVQEFNLFSSVQYGGKNLMFSDSTVRLQQVPFGTDRFLYLGAQYTDKLQSLHKVRAGSEARISTIRWCAVAHDEMKKCDLWSGNSLTEDGNSAIECQTALSVEECFKKIMRHEADAVAVDGGQVYTAGKCGLVPAMVEQYDEGKCSSSSPGASSYYAVAVIKKNSGVTWANLQGRRSCHTGYGRTAGWNIPMGLIHKEKQDCDFTKFFSAGCAPGADPLSPFCNNCKGSGQSIGSDTAKCKASSEEQYYGYAGAFRCLAEGAGDVAFIKHTIVGENTDAHAPAWANTLSSEEFALICPQKAESVPISDYASCNLAQVPAHAVMTRPDIKSEVVSILNAQQVKFGQTGSEGFRMFQSNEGKNLLFKDSTKCLQEIQNDSYETFLGEGYMTAMNSLRVCTDNTPDLEKSCTFQSCQ